MEPRINAVIVSGRAVANFKKCGQKPDPEDVILDCLRCRMPVAVSLEGALKIRDAMRESPTVLAGAVCTPCLLLVVALRPPDQVSMTSHGANLAESNTAAKEMLSRLMKSVRG